MPLLRCLFGDLQLDRGFGRGQVLEVAQNQNLTVTRVHRVESLLKSDLHFGPNSRRVRLALPAQQFVGQCRGGRLRKRAPMKRDFSTGRPHLHAKVLPVNLEEFLTGDEPQPDPGTDPYLSGVYIHDNELVDNGLDPRGLVLAIPPQVEDVLWDGIVEPDVEASLCLSESPPPFRNFNLSLIHI